MRNDIRTSLRSSATCRRILLAISALSIAWVDRSFRETQVQRGRARKASQGEAKRRQVAALRSGPRLPPPSRPPRRRRQLRPSPPNPKRSARSSSPTKTSAC